MAELRLSLCPDCQNCPEVVVRESGVLIGEGPETVALTPEQWNELVTAVLEGRLGKLPLDRAERCECGCGCGS